MSSPLHWVWRGLDLLNQGLGRFTALLFLYALFNEIRVARAGEAQGHSFVGALWQWVRRRFGAT